MMLNLGELYDDDDEDGEGEVYDEVYDVRLEPWMSARHPDCDFSLGSKPIPLLLCEHTHNSTCCLYLHKLFRFFAQHWHDDAIGYLLKGVGGGLGGQWKNIGGQSVCYIVVQFVGKICLKYA